jgi:hypothetical protein
MDACLAKGTGWRLPNIREIDSIRDQSNSSAPYTDLPNIVSDFYLTSTSISQYYADTIYFPTGGTSSNAEFRSSNLNVRCVRDQ